MKLHKNQQGMECSICYEEITKDTGKAELSCSHSFHLKCLSQWFTKNESCPCCRHEANDTEKMHFVDEEEEEDEDSESDSDSDSDSETSDDSDLDAAATREHARHHFIIKRATLTKASYEAYAATRIAALVRGHQSRTFFFEYKCWVEDENEARFAMGIAEKDLRKAKAAQMFYKKLFSMTRPQQRVFAATMIQSIWRTKRQHEVYKAAKLVKDLEKGLRVNWIRENGIWKRTFTL